jgi:hypothetical protein
MRHAQTVLMLQSKLRPGRTSTFGITTEIGATLENRTDDIFSKYALEIWRVRQPKSPSHFPVFR